MTNWGFGVEEWMDREILCENWREWDLRGLGVDLGVVVFGV